MENENLEINMGNLEHTKRTLIFDLESDAFKYKVTQLTSDSIDFNNNPVNIFRYKYLIDIKKELIYFDEISGIENKKEVLTKVEDNLSIFLADEFKINNFYFGKTLLKKLLEYKGNTFYIFFEELFLESFEIFINSNYNIHIPVINDNSAFSNITNSGIIFGELKGDKIYFKHEFFDTPDSRKNSFDFSEVNLYMEEFLSKQKDNIIDSKINKLDEIEYSLSYLMKKLILNYNINFRFYDPELDSNIKDYDAELVNSVMNISLFIENYKDNIDGVNNLGITFIKEFIVFFDKKYFNGKFLDFMNYFSNKYGDEYKILDHGNDKKFFDFIYKQITVVIEKIKNDLLIDKS